MNPEMDDSVAYVPAGFHSPDSSLLFPSACLSPPSLSLSLSLPSPTPPPLSPFLPLSLWMCLCLPACLWRRESSPCRVGDRGSAAETDIIPFREEVFPSRYLHPLSLSLCLALPIFLYTLSLLTQPLTRSLCTVVSSSHLTLPPLIVSYLPLHIPTSFQAATRE